MKKALHYSGFFIFLFFLCNNASAYVTTSGNVSGQYWHNTDTYYVNGSLTVDAGTTFEIQAGTRVKFAPGTSINVYGTIIANGTLTSNIIFTSMDEDDVGEIIAGSDGNPNPGDWKTIKIDGNGTNTGTAVFDHVQIRYGGYGGNGNVYAYYADSFSITNSLSSTSFSDGIKATGGAPLIENCEINNNDGYAAYLNIVTVTNYSGNSGSGNTINAFGIGGIIDQDYTLSESVCGFPFVLVGGVTLNESYSMTIPAGEVIKASGGGLIINGTLNAIGTGSQNIVFTSLKDDTYGGDLNGDGTATLPAKGDWNSISLDGNGTKQGIGNMDYCKVLYAGGNPEGAVVFSRSNEGYFKNSTIQYSDSRGFYAEYDTLQVTNNQFLDNDTYGVCSHSDAVLDLSNSTFNNNGDHGIYAYYSGELQIDNCQFNNNGGYAAFLFIIDNLPQFTSNNGSGNTINAFGISGIIDQNYTLSGSVCGFPFVLVGGVTLNESYSMTIPAGEVIKASGGGLIINGTLNAIGTGSQNIVFTSLKDDTYGGDLNGDGTATLPAKGDWNSISMDGTGTKQGIGNMDHCKVLYSGGGNTAAVTFDRSDGGCFTNSLIQYSDHRGFSTERDTLNILNSAILDSDYYGLLSDHSVLNIDGCIFNNNGYDGLYNYSGGELQINNCQFNNNGGYAASLGGLNIKSYTNNSGSGNNIDAFAMNGTIDTNLVLSESVCGFPYLLSGTTTITDDHTVTIPAGEVIKLDNGTLQVDGALNIMGTKADSVIFTSIKDDTYGGDWNNDGNASMPAPGDWDYIYLNGSSDHDGIANINYCRIRYGGDIYANIRLYGCDSVSISNSVIEYSETKGLYNHFSNPVIRSTEFINNNSYGIHIDIQPVPDLGGNSLEEAGLNTFINNDGGNFQIYNQSSTEIDAYYNDWGYYTEAEIDAHIYDDDENATKGIVNFNPWYDPASPPFVIDFMADQTTGSAPFTVQFTNLSNGSPSNWAWDFDNDGTIDSEDQNPVWEYSDAGLYTVVLTVDYGIYSAAETKTDFIEVNDLVSIYDIQYTTDPGPDDLYPSPYVGQTVITTGIVTATGYNGYSNNFFISSSDGGAWEGIFVYDALESPALGDSVVLEGEITEYYGLTEVHTPSVTIVSSGHTLPDPFVISTSDLGIPANAEPWEGSIVKVENVTVVLEPDAENEWYVTDGSGNARIDDFMFYYPALTGQEFDFIIGALDYSWDEYGINPRFADDLASSPDQTFALSFDGTDDFVKTGGVPFPTDDLTIEAWIYPTNLTGYQEIVFFYNDIEGVQFRLQDDGSLIYLESANSGYEYVVSPSGKIQTNEWTHVAVTKAGDLCTLYINGLPSGYNHFDRNPVPDTISIGARSKYMDRFFAGAMDDIRIWTVARTQAEIQGNMGIYPDGTETGLYVYYQLNDGPGQTAHDLTANGFDGTLGVTPDTDDNDPVWIITEWPHPYDTGYVVDIKAYLEGPFNGTVMNTLPDSLIPLQQPYNEAPWNYSGTESVVALPNSEIVDWILVEYRDAASVNEATPATSIGGQAAFILNDGSIVDMSGNTPLVFAEELINDLYIVLWHRNHLPVLSSGVLSESGGIYGYDFTSLASKAYGNNQNDLGGSWGMIGGDANADGTIDENDGIDSWYPYLGQSGYFGGDANLDGQVNNPDKNDVWWFNQGKSEIFPNGSSTWNCGDALIDNRDSQSYSTIQIGDQCWMAENLNVGSMITSNISSDNQTDNGLLEKYCYDNDPANCEEYGGLYQWEEAMQYTTTEGTQGICPDGWHLPADGEFCTLASFLDPTVSCSGTGLRGTDAGGKLKESGTAHWNSPNTGATNESGFAALPGAYRYYNGNFDYKGYYGYYWQSTDYGTNHYYWYMAFNSAQIGRHQTPYGFGFSVRCIRDQIINQPPAIPSNPQPEDDAINQSVNATLNWSCSDPENDLLSYDVYFGENDPPAFVSSAQSAQTFDPGNLASETQYFWKITAHDDQGNTTEGPVWNFTTESLAWSCGDDFVDVRDSQSYTTVQIGDQCWMAENLNIGLRIDGNLEMSEDTIIEKYCYDDDENNCDVYGGLYQWEEIMHYIVGQGAQGICPSGWYVATNADWNVLASAVGEDGNSLKAIGQGTGQGVGTNTSGFSALLGGERSGDGTFNGMDSGVTFWNSTSQTAGWSYRKGINSTTGGIYGGVSTINKGYPVRCMKQ